ncbi:MAG: gluconate 2-dehydrogenase subunit 3 family protein [Erythrobacter sp.]|nr:MAG: gluconate 2-dehydrogenase subunit 3 family protein [Erythrobacter sp.]
MTATGWNRREFVRAAALLGLALATPGCVTAAALDPAQAPSEDDLAFITRISDMVIPATDTPGAAEADVGAFVLLALAHGLDGARAPLAPNAVSTTIRTHLLTDGSLDHLRWLRAILGEDATEESLAALDAAAFSGDAEAQPWKLLKGLILTGYYTSRIGGSQELAYAPIPGRFDPMVPVGPETRAYSNEWTGVEFG